MTADITLRGPGDVVGVLPYQLGYHPHDSVVVVSLRGRRVGLVARADLPPDDHVDGVAASLLGPLLRDGATSVIVVGYEDVADASHPLLLSLVEQLERAGVDVVDVAVVRGGRRFSAVCSEPCCPPEGVPLPDPADVPGVVEYVGLGRSPLPSRGAVEHLVAADPRACAGVADAVDARSGLSRRRRRRRAAVAWATALRESRGGPGPARAGAGLALADPVVLADLVLGLRDVSWRDGLIAWLAPGVLPVDKLDEVVVELLRSALPAWGGMGFGARGISSGADAGRAERVTLAMGREDLLQRLLALCRSVPDDCPREAAAICTVAAHLAWVTGDGALARVAVDRALRLQPAYRLALLLEELIDRGLRLPQQEAPRGEPGALGCAG